MTGSSRTMLSGSLDTPEMSGGYYPSLTEEEICFAYFQQTPHITVLIQLFIPANA